MPSKKPRFTIYTDEETKEKIRNIAAENNTTDSKYIGMLIDEDIKKYESKYKKETDNFSE